MRHLREDYDAIQPWPTKRSHYAKDPQTRVTLEWGWAADGSVDPIIPDDEPVFLLRAKDKLAPVVVRQWAAMARRNGDTALAYRVEAWATEMEQYAAEHYDLP